MSSVPVAQADSGDDQESSFHRRTGAVYVNNNTTGANTVSGFRRGHDGSLTPLPGSPYATGGTGTGAAIGSQGALQVTEDGRFVLAVDAGSNQISVLRVRHDGSLNLVDGGAVASGGNLPISVAVRNKLVYVANGGDTGASYAGFRLSEQGRLFPIPGAIYPIADGAPPRDVLISGDGKTLVGTRPAASLIDSFHVRLGRLIAAPGSPFASQGPGPLGSAFRPTNPDQLFVSNASGGPGNGSVSVYDVSHNGSLTAMGAATPNGQTAPCWLEISPNGRYLFTANTPSNSISRYRIAHDGSLTHLGNTALTGAGLRPFDLRMDRSGRYLYATDAAGAVSGFSVDGGKLTELQGSPFALPAGATPFGIVVR